MRDSIATDLFTMDNYEMLVKLRKYMTKLKAQFTTKEDEEYISKEEILAGIDAGLKDVKEGRCYPVETLFAELEKETL